MRLGYPLTADVKIGNLNLGECEVIPALDGTMTVKFEKGELSLDTLNEVFMAHPSVVITEEDGTVTTYESRDLQAYRVEASGKAEVSFLTNFMPEPIEESEVVE